MINIELYEDINLSVWRIAGKVTADEIIEELETFTSDGRFRAGMNVLGDNRQSETIHNEEEFDLIVNACNRCYGKFPGKTKCASVFSTDVQFGMANVFRIKSHDSPLEFCQFNSLSDALNWLEIPEDQQSRIS